MVESVHGMPAGVPLVFLMLLPGILPGCADRGYLDDIVPGTVGAPCLDWGDPEDRCGAGLRCDGKLGLCVSGAADVTSQDGLPIAPAAPTVAPSTEACTEAVMLTAVEVHYPDLGPAMAALETVVTGKGYEVVSSSGRFRYVNAVGDSVHLADDGRIVVTTSCALNGLGVLRRLSGALVELAGFIMSAQPGADKKAVSNALCTPVALYAQSGEGEAAVVAPTGSFSDGGGTKGYLAVPSGTSQAALSVCGYNWQAGLEITATLNGETALDRVSPGSTDGAFFTVWYDLSDKLVPGTFGVTLSGSFGCGWGCDGRLGTHFVLLGSGAGAAAASWSGESEGYGTVVDTTPLKDLELP